MPSLKMTRGPEVGKIYELTAREVIIGSGIRNDIVVQNGDVSPRHCRLEKSGATYRLFDSGSKRGTFVSGKLVLGEGVQLKSRMTIELGENVAFEYSPGDVTEKMEAVEGEFASQILAPKTFYLVIKRASEPQPEVYSLDMHNVTIGRDLDNDIVIPEAKISRQHLRLERVNKGYIVTDMKTSNGTYVNKHRIELPTLLQTGDHIAVADAVEMWFTDNLDALKM
jgi:pSer/pThr/pTyr-binding forkhead associated (FHA) protein